MKSIAARPIALSLAVVAAVLTAACGGSDRPDPMGPEETDVAGHYTLIALAFDPQGSLPEVDLLARMTGPAPTLVLANDGRAQLVYRDPETNLVELAEAQFVIMRDGNIQFTFDEETPLHNQTLLSPAMRFTFSESPKTLAFDTNAPGGIDRTTLLQLVPEWEEEQLFDPVPGHLRVTYRVED